MNTDPMPWRPRFLTPRYALASEANEAGFTVGRASTPAGDTRVALFVAASSDAPTGWSARFAVFGPPVLIACADWVCEYLSGSANARCSMAFGSGGGDAAACPSIMVFERELNLAAADRFAAIMVQDAVVNAMNAIDRH
ncbi:hypothetical protein HKX42_02620 [Salinisphaera sp. USBA-960]|uniref:hypothetical protein n=1 Tax=Salinisphaera orenii TaxID=856731 RepID=UPI0014751164|nr:hypothetical protein [Salifodinibacter halophilus]